MTATSTSSAPRSRSRPPSSRLPPRQTSPRQTGLVKGYIGPGRRWLCGTVCSIRGSSPGTQWVTGADEHERHVFGLVAGRDFTGDGVVEISDVRAGDPAPDGSGPIEAARGMEIGHVFQLGRKYAEALGLQVLDEHGKLVTVTMGSYGIGVTRIMAVIAESNHDEKGLIWPKNVAPFDVHVVAAGRDDAVFATAEVLVGLASRRAGSTCSTTTARRSRPGVKFGDAELLGVPTVVVVGREAGEGLVELWDRRAGTKETVPIGELAARPRLIGRGTGRHRELRQVNTAEASVDIDLSVLRTMERERDMQFEELVQIIEQAILTAYLKHTDAGAGLRRASASSSTARPAM